MKPLKNLAVVLAVFAGLGSPALAQTASQAASSTNAEPGEHPPPAAPNASATRLSEALARSGTVPLQGSRDASQTAPAAAPDNGGHQAVQMHGRWVIDVKKPDGTLTQHREFENALQPSGMDFLIALMAGTVQPNNYLVSLTPPSGGSLICYSSNALDPAHACDIITGPSIKDAYICADQIGSDPCQPGLTSSFTHDGPDPGLFNAMVLTGTFTATASGQIGVASTYFVACTSSQYSVFVTNPPPPQSPAVCTTIDAAFFYGPLSQFTLVDTTGAPSPLQVLVNDIVVVKVTITFS